MKEMNIFEKRLISLYLLYKKIFKKITKRYILILIRENYNPELSLRNKIDLLHDHLDRSLVPESSEEKKKRILSLFARTSPIPRHYLDPRFFTQDSPVSTKDYVITICTEVGLFSRPNPKLFISPIPSYKYMRVEIDH